MYYMCCLKTSLRTYASKCKLFTIYWIPQNKRKNTMLSLEKTRTPENICLMLYDEYWSYKTLLPEFMTIKTIGLDIKQKFETILHFCYDWFGNRIRKWNERKSYLYVILTNQYMFLLKAMLVWNFAYRKLLAGIRLLCLCFSISIDTSFLRYLTLCS